MKDDTNLICLSGKEHAGVLRLLDIILMDFKRK